MGQRSSSESRCASSYLRRVARPTRPRRRTGVTTTAPSRVCSRSARTGIRSFGWPKSRRERAFDSNCARRARPRRCPRRCRSLLSTSSRAVLWAQSMSAPCSAASVRKWVCHSCASRRRSARAPIARSRRFCTASTLIIYAFLHRCRCGGHGPDCTASPCPAGYACLEDPCGRHCAPSGAACASDTDCPPSSRCRDGFCRASGACADSRDCPAGHACESGACADRRIGCRPVEGFDCPWGFVYDGDGVLFCRRALRRCASDAPCERGDRCVDVDGDGSGESLGLGTCSTHRDCAVERLRCATSPAERSASCEPYGGCREASDCPAGFECCDLWGDGLRECVEAGGCRSSADCPKRGIGGTHSEGGPLQCMTQPLDA